MRKRVVRVGIVGTGGISRQHVKAYTAAGGFRIVAVCDIVPEKAQQAAQEWGVRKSRVFSRVEDLVALDEVDAVSVCTFNQAHREPTVAALEAGKHVFCEKPMAATLEDATAMVRAARRSGKVLQIGIHSTFRPEVQLARKLVDAGVLGDFYYGETTGCRRRGIPGRTFIYKRTAGAGAVVDIGVYNLHNALYILNYPKPVRVSAITADYLAHQDPRWDEMDVEEFGVAWIRLEGGAVLIFKISWAVHQDSLGPTYFLGTRAGIQLGGPVLYLDAVTPEIEALVREAGGELEVREGQAKLPTVHVQGLPRTDVWVAQMTAFREAVLRGGPSPIPPEGVLLTNVVMDGIFRSHERGEEVPVSVPKLDE